MKRFVACSLVAAAVMSMLPVQAAGCYPVPDAVCKEIPGHMPPVPLDAQVVVVQHRYVPDAVEVRQGRNVYFQSLDTIDHTATDPQCLDGDAKTTCRFNTAIPIGARGQKAAVLWVSPAFAVGKTYTWVCALPGHTESGSFTVR